MFIVMQYQALSAIIAVLFGLLPLTTAVASLKTERESFQVQVFSIAAGRLPGDSLGSLVLNKDEVTIGSQQSAMMLTLSGQPGQQTLSQVGGGDHKIVLAYDKSRHLLLNSTKVSHIDVLWKHLFTGGSPALGRHNLVPVDAVTKQVLTPMMCQKLNQLGYGNFYIPAQYDSQPEDCHAVALIIPGK